MEAPSGFPRELRKPALSVAPMFNALGKRQITPPNSFIEKYRPSPMIT
jgi:hypothetical protein